MNRSRGVLIAGLAVVLAFAAGFAWQYVRAEELESRIETLERTHAFTAIETRLAAATVAAQRGQYDVALEQASGFFTALQRHAAEAPPAAREELDAILAQRDPTITLLSRGDPSSADVLARTLVRYRVALGGPEQALPIAASPPQGGG